MLWRLAKVFRTAFWMKAWGARSPKRTVVWSNSPYVRRFRTGKLRPSTDEEKRVLLVRKYTDTQGRKRFVGKKVGLKRSGYPIRSLCFLFKANFCCFDYWKT